METASIVKKEGEETLLKFLKHTKEGKYAEIEESSLPYSRLPELREENFYDEEYYYSMR